MPEVFGVPLHPALSHLPIAATLLAAAALAAARFRAEAERPGWARGARLLILVALAAAPFSIGTGRAWADSLGLLPGGEWLPSAAARNGLLRRHVLSAAAATVLLALALLPLRRSRLRLALLLAFLAAVAMALAGHFGGAMVHTILGTR
ncbi:MAG: hypothetical protein ABIT01_00445 [Thermoanaerobaculia bacterium]